MFQINLIGPICRVYMFQINLIGPICMVGKLSQIPRGVSFHDYYKSSDYTVPKIIQNCVQLALQLLEHSKLL